MRLRPRPSPPLPGPAERVRDLLAGGSGGWVPSPDPASGGLPALLARAPAQPPHADGPATGDADDAAADDHDRPADDELSGPGPGSSWQRPRLDRPAAGPLDGTAGRSPLPWPRLDPGRRGAAALVVVALLAAVTAGGLVLRSRPQEVAAPDVVGTGVALPGASPTAAATQGSGEVVTGEVVVAVAGKVVRPGLVRLPAGSRVDDAVRAAGGPLPGADAGLLNLARKLVDGEQVLVGVDPPPGAPAGPAAGPAAAGPLDLNRATAADLDALPGIGPVLAQRIVDWRTEHGRFASVEQLREVTGIGESK